MTENDRKVLSDLHHTGEDWARGFDPICIETGLDRRTVRLSCRRLARKGFAKYYRSLWDDDGTPAGAGYAITPAGVKALQACN